MFRFVGVSKTYDAFAAVDHLDLTIAPERTTVLIGPSGCGKSTLLRLMVGLIWPEQGQVFFHDVPLTPASARPMQRRIGYVIQEGGLFPHLTARRNVVLMARYLRQSRRTIQERLGQLTALAQLSPELLDHYPGELSGGQRQRVSLMRALMLNPDVLLLDEPLGALDLKLREQMQIELKAIQRELGITFVIVTHDQDEALTLCDRLAVFNNGRVEQLGAAREVYENPVNRFVADFVGTSNVLDGADAQALLGRAGTYAIRPERVVLLDADEVVPAGMRSVSARVAEVVYAGPVTRVAADTDAGQRLTATLVSARTRTDIAHDAAVVLAWHDDAVRTLAVTP